MNLLPARYPEAHYLLIVSFIVFSIAGSGRARPSPFQVNLYSAHGGSISPGDLGSSAMNSIAEHLTPHNSSDSHWSLQKRLTRSCDPLPLTPATWKQLELDSYLQNYPDGQKLNLPDYAASKGAPNFVCGIGSICNAGQMCYPVTDNDWYILFAIQQWNTINNMLFMAIGYAVSIVQASVNSLVSTMFPAVDASGIIHSKQSLAISGAMTEVSGTLMMDIMVMVESATGPIGWALNVLNFGLAAGFGAWAYSLKTPKGPLKDGFAVWTDVIYSLSDLEQTAQTVISDAVKKVVRSPISSKDGLYGVLKGGAYLNPAKMLPIPDVADHLRKVTLAMCTNLVLRSLNTFISVGADDCNDKGVNGAWPQKDVLSYCPKRGGPMYNVVRAAGDRTENSIPNANVLNEIFGFSTKMIIDVSLNSNMMIAFSTYQSVIVDREH
ncbi:hypothetical protein PCANC_10489 [Puccinia coronata f. sp. avenae]|uniref:DUF7872 domain-containing protein n=1 Tax=Puccinia coronata f. sp. avenae TaxID=200324 RepID=A0A2N5UXB3_9BASI|nr:hypothetical protein PCANC_12300 [Puccinia coronata f. sp. avenae]PLW42327.1 hypothetical protein PCANC_10489 [Puccinia coronata f. sp. avenae]